jgi:citryl-CoA lyase
MAEKKTEWKTSISKASSEGTTIRGYNLEELTKKLSFTETIYLTLKGELPTKEQTKMLDAIFVSSIDHGIEVSSVTTARCTMAAGNQFNSSVAAGIGTLGKYHGGAIEDCAKFLENNINSNITKIVKQSIENKKRIGGFGHKIYTTDPRTLTLFQIAKENNCFGKYCKLAEEIESELEKQKGKKLCINIDGAIASLILDLGFDSKLANAFFIISRTVGLCAHVHEEKTCEKPVRRLSESEYTGKVNREL